MNSAVVLLNVLSFYDPLRQLIKSSIDQGFIHSSNENLVVFVDGPDSPAEHETFDWGAAGLKAIETWEADSIKPLYNWAARMKGKGSSSEPLMEVS